MCVKYITDDAHEHDPKIRGGLGSTDNLIHTPLDPSTRFLATGAFRGFVPKFQLHLPLCLDHPQISASLTTKVLLAVESAVIE